ncbi:hypothetical protein D187_007487 [Cystobacter fuscus DSM 2262]|uniref:Uncharacterized protein n=1 Tax=Cystobacter fuscus (strain ATCC 25194 / DSM 2262 / NBRC 100088 / M29) TaxID=1242864 RepID=S9NVG0_CYSF2|nr:hypothetical protein [Cystobacter fuscus]EPX56145.1 hypothetical protein D187_007487 [Cystobacter fuscus DSM 2262]
MGETTRLTDEQREQHFLRGLALERALAGLPAIRERFLAALARQEEALRAQHTRHFAAATTGEDPDATAHQQALPLDAPASAQPTAQKRSKPAPEQEEQPDPEPPRGPGRPQRRPATEAKGEKRAGKAASARTATVAEATPVEDDAVPAPAVPCCTCGDSLADHTSPQGAIGACRAKKCPAKPRCRAFQLGRVLGWTLTWQGGWKETNDKPVFFLSQRETDVAKHGPLLPQEGGLVYADPVRLGRQTNVLEAARTKGEWSCVKGLRGVPLRVLEVVARVLAESSPAAPFVPVSAQETCVVEARERKAAKREEDDTPSECDGCTSEFPASQLQPVGPEGARGFYCEKCRAEIAHTSPTSAPAAPQATPSASAPPSTAPAAPAPVDMFGRPWPAVDAALFPGWYVDVTPGFNGKSDSLSAGRLHELFLWVDVVGPEEQRVEHLQWFPSAQGGPDVRRSVISSGGALATLLPAGFEAALVAYLSTHWLLPEETKHANAAPVATATKKAHARKTTRGLQEDESGTPSTPAAPPAQLELGGTPESEQGVPIDAVSLDEVGDLKQVLRLLRGTKDSGPGGARLRRVVSVLATAAREESWAYLQGHHGWCVLPHPHEKRGEVWLAYGTRALCTLGPWLWDGQTLTRAADWAAPHSWPTKGMKADVVLPEFEAALRKTLASLTEAPAPQTQSTGGTWRVELPERLEGRDFIIPLWLVNDATGERRAASWWGRSGLKPSHHLSGTLRDAALEEHVALQAWWKEHAETVVKPLEQACRDGAVPGLSVAGPVEPHAVGPFFYALSGGWRLEVWEPWTGEPHSYFANGTERHGPFAWEKGWLVASDVGAISWAQGAAHVVREAEDFVTRGFVLELRRAEGRR